jgi:UDP-GlcNAc:undecaprenyl-phosphate GlcNAc-1-phosphate transferase
MSRGLTQLMLGSAALLTAFFISLVLTPIIRRAALRRGFVDHPAREAHKAHARTVPFGGGIAITTAIMLPMLLALLISLLFASSPAEAPVAAGALEWRAWMGGVRLKAMSGIAIILGGVILHMMGLMDDKRSLGAMTKLAIQGVIALVLTAGFGIRILDVLGAPLAIILTTLWIVTLTNGFNFLDNMDGLSAGVAFLTATILAVTSFRAGQIFVPCTLMLVAGAVLGFLVFNFPPAGIFMGDAGSLVVGYMLAVLSVLITFYDPEMGRTPFGVLVPVVVFAIPLYDLISVCWHRQRSGRSIFSADRGHFSHRLVKLGMSPTLAVLTIYLATLATSLPAMLLPQLGWAGAILVFGQCLCVVTIIAILETRHER